MGWAGSLEESSKKNSTWRINPVEITKELMDWIFWIAVIMGLICAFVITHDLFKPEK